MLCINCGGTLCTTVDSVKQTSLLLGCLLTDPVEVEKCMNCDKIVFPYYSAKQVGEFVRHAEQKAIEQLPIGEFITIKQVSEILEISIEKIRDDKRISRGFIIQHKVGPVTLYFRPSVERYKQIGDGRILLRKTSINERGYLP